MEGMLIKGQSIFRFEVQKVSAARGRDVYIDSAPRNPAHETQPPTRCEPTDSECVSAAVLPRAQSDCNF